MFKIAITGHRPKKLAGGYNLASPENVELQNRIADLVADKYQEHGSLRMISGMALGIDTMYALIALGLKQHDYNVTLEAAIPCKDHSSKWFNKVDVDRWHDIVAAADIVTQVSDKAYDYKCMQDRNEYMVDTCDLLIAVWDGTPGGTANCIKYAKKQNKEIICEKVAHWTGHNTYTIKNVYNQFIANCTSLNLYLIRSERETRLDLACMLTSQIMNSTLFGTNKIMM